MIVYAATAEQLHLILSGDAADIWKQTRLELGCDDRAAFFCAEDAVDKSAGV